jgi:(R,R)-butanediol dehydrogenase / meso-butanediol dehydrogenase / diacetyl reductase
MKAIVWTAVNQLEIQNVAQPRPGAGEALLRVSHVGICGTDLHIWHGEHPRAKPPLIMGHELSATIAALGAGVSGWAAGDPVVVYPVIGCGQCKVCRMHGEHICGKLGLYGIDWPGAMAEYVVVQARRLHRLPQNLDLAQAALVEPIAVGLHTMKVAGFHGGDVVAVVGAGPIGIAVALCAREAGAGQVFISDVSDFRLNIARQLGFQAISATSDSLSEAVRAATGGDGAEFVFECTGIPAAAKQMLDPVAIAGTLVAVGIFPGAIPVDLRAIAFRELKLVGIRMYTPADFDRAIELVSSGRLDVRPLISDIYPLDRGIEAFRRTAAGTDNIKILIKV